MSNVSDKSISVFSAVASTSNLIHTICEPFEHCSNRNVKKEWTCLLQQVLRRLFEAEQKKKHQPNLSHFCCNLPLSICHTIVTKVLFHKNCAVHFISITFSINFVFFHFSVSIFLPRLLSLFIFFHLTRFCLVLAYFLHFCFLLLSPSLSIIYVYSLFLSIYLFLILLQ